MKLVHFLGAALAGTAIGTATLFATPKLAVFSGIAGRSNPPAQKIRITKTATTPTSWRVVGVQRPWLIVTPKDGTAPDSVGLGVNIAGLRAGTYTDTVRIVPTTAADTLIIPVVLTLTNDSVLGSGPRAPRPAIYEIELSFTGYTGLVEAPNCVQNTQGYDRLVGTVTGIETSASDEDVVYIGTLRRDTDIDFCETKGKDAPGDDERVMCSATLVGYAVTQVELTVYSDEGTGAFVKAVPAGGPMMRTVSGSCDQAEKNEMFSAYPTATDGGAASPSGQPIDDDAAVDPIGRRITFVAGGVPRLRVGTFPPTGPQGGWTLKVVRKIQ